MAVARHGCPEVARRASMAVTRPGRPGVARRGSRAASRPDRPATGRLAPPAADSLATTDRVGRRRGRRRHPRREAPSERLETIVAFRRSPPDRSVATLTLVSPVSPRCSSSHPPGWETHTDRPAAGLKSAGSLWTRRVPGGTLIPILARIAATTSWAGSGRLPVAAAAPVTVTTVSRPAPNSPFAPRRRRTFVDPPGRSSRPEHDDGLTFAGELGFRRRPTSSAQYTRQSPVARWRRLVLVGIEQLIHERVVKGERIVVESCRRSHPTLISERAAHTVTPSASCSASSCCASARRPRWQSTRTAASDLLTTAAVSRTVIPTITRNATTSR